MKTERLNPGKVILCGKKGRNVKFEVKLEKETMRLNLNGMADLFATDKNTVRHHLTKIFKESELKRKAAGKAAPSAQNGIRPELSGSLFPSLCIRLLRELPGVHAPVN